jgi:PncC family amidohydrolase
MKNCLVFIKNKKLNNNFDRFEDVCVSFASGGYNFDKVSLIAYDSSQEITSQLKECREVYDNTVVLCNSLQLSVIADYVGRLYGVQMQQDNVFDNGEKSLFIVDDSANLKAETGKIVAYLNKKYAISYDKMCIKAVGAPAELINKAIEQSQGCCADMTFNVYSDFEDTTIEITYSSNTPKMVADGVMRTFVTILDDYIYALEDISLAQRLYELLKLRRMKISVAESFTGGGICKKLVEVSGVSQVFFEGLNTYSNEAKMGRLGVNEITLKQFGAVSDETAYQMAEGLIKSGNCDISIATTGIAGPKSDNTNKPVGLAYIAIGLKERIAVYKFNFSGDRTNITNTAINQALFLAYKNLK